MNMCFIQCGRHNLIIWPGNLISVTGRRGALSAIGDILACFPPFFPSVCTYSALGHLLFLPTVHERRSVRQVSHAKVSHDTRAQAQAHKLPTRDRRYCMINQSYRALSCLYSTVHLSENPYVRQ